MFCEESMTNRSSEFWGICCEGGKKYSQVVRRKFHMTMAALDPTVTPTSPVVSLMVDRGGCEYLLCSLRPSTILQVNLNLYFDKGEKVTFSLIGQGKIHLSGYHIYDNNDSIPAATKQKVSEIASRSKTNDKKKGSAAVSIESDDSDVQEISKKVNKISQLVSPKKGKEVKKSKVDESDEDSEDDDSFDELEEEEEDSSEDEESEEGTEGDKKDSKRLQSYKRLWSSLTQSDEAEDSEDSDEDEDTLKKIGKEFQSKKRPKSENSVTIVNDKPAKNSPGKSVAVDDVKLVNKSPKQDLLNSSIGRTPMPQKKAIKENLTNSLKAATPKKVNFVDVESSDSDNEEDPATLNTTPSKATEPTTPSSETKKKRKKKKKNKSTSDASNATNESPSQLKGLSSASYSQKLPGGLQYEDIRVGNGPIAKKGRLVHVYYTGMLENNRVFDSREIGNKPFSFKLGADQVIKGWDMAVEGMKVGGKRRMKIPPSLGYANARTGPIPPNSTLYFTVELKAVS